MVNKMKSVLFRATLYIIFRISLYSVFFILPVLGMLNCDGWNEGTGAVTSCVIDGSFFRSYANFYFSFITISSFTLLMPLILYVVVTFKFSNILVSALMDKMNKNA